MRLPEDTLKKPSAFPGLGMGRRVEEVLLKGLAIFPRDRWKSIGELQAALDAALREDAAEEEQEKKKKPPVPGPVPIKEMLQGLLDRAKALPPRALGVGAAGCAALLLLALVVPRLLSGGEAAPVGGQTSSPPPAGSQISSLPPAESGGGVSLAVPPAGEWEKPAPDAVDEAVQLRQPEDPDAVVKLSDWALEYHLRKAMNKPTGDFTAGELAQVQRLHIYNIVCTVNDDPPTGEGTTGITTRMGSDADVAEPPHVLNLSDLTYFINLRELSLVHQTGGNELWSSFEPIGELEGLTYLDLRGNRCRYQNLEPLGKLTRLEYLSLEDLYYESGDHFFTGITDLSFLAGLTELRELNLSDNNRLTDLSVLGGLTKLETLDLSHLGSESEERILDLTPLAKLPALQKLNLEFSHARWSTLAGLTRLRELNLYYTGISDLSVLLGMTDLERLNLDSAQVSDYSPLAGLTNLEYLDLSKSNITDLSDLSPLTKMKELYLKDCDVSSLAPLAGMEQLEVLSLRKTLTSQGYDAGPSPVRDLTPLARMTRLREFYALGLEAADYSPLSGLPSLEVLELDYCGIDDLSFVKSLTGLTSLTARYNQISDLSPLSGLRQLEELNFYQNEISDPSALSGLQGLTSVTLSKNQIRTLDPLAGAVGMKELRVEDGLLTDLDALAAMDDLELVMVTNNQIVNIDGLSGKKKLGEAWLGSNKITDLGPLGDAGQLATLLVQGNPITDWTPVAHVKNVRQ